MLSGPVSLQDVTIRCGDAWAAMNPATVSQQGPSVFAAEVTIKAAGFGALCAVWPHDPGVSGTVRSTVPIVFLNGTADPGDPPASVAAATATMPNALLVAVPGIGHWTLNWNPHPGCLLAATTAFIQAGQPASPAPWDACTRALASEPIALPRALKPGHTRPPEQAATHAVRQKRDAAQADHHLPEPGRYLARQVAGRGGFAGDHERRARRLISRGTRPAKTAGQGLRTSTPRPLVFPLQSQPGRSGSRFHRQVVPWEAKRSCRVDRPACRTESAMPPVLVPSNTRTGRGQGATPGLPATAGNSGLAVDSSAGPSARGQVTYAPARLSALARSCNQRTSVLIIRDGSQPEGGVTMPNVIDDRGAGPDAQGGREQLAREQAIKQIQRKRRFWTGAAWSGIGMVILVIIWALTEYHNAGGWPTSGFSQSSGIHDVWNFWIVYPIGAWVLLMVAGAWSVSGPGRSPKARSSARSSGRTGRSADPRRRGIRVLPGAATHQLGARTSTEASDDQYC